MKVEAFNGGMLIYISQNFFGSLHTN